MIAIQERTPFTTIQSKDLAQKLNTQCGQKQAMKQQQQLKRTAPHFISFPQLVL